MLQCIHFLQCDVSCFSYARLQNDARSRKNRPFEVTFETFPEMKRLRLCQSVLFSVLLPSSLIVGLSGSAYSSQFNKTKDGKRKKAAREGLESISSDKPVSFSGRSLIRKWRARPTDASRLDNNFLLTKRQIEWEREREREKKRGRERETQCCWCLPVSRFRDNTHTAWLSGKPVILRRNKLNRETALFLFF